MVQREDTAMAWRPCSLEMRRVRFSVTPLNEFRKVAGYGLPGRFAKPCDLRVMWVQIPCLPLYRRMTVVAPMVKWTSSLASNEMFQVRVLVGVHGVRGVAVTAHLAVNQEVRVRLPSDTPFGMMKYE